MDKPPPPIYPRKFVTLPGKSDDQSDFSVMQFNLLADGLSGSDPKLGGFINIDKNVLDFSFRKNRLLEEISRADTDIICVQELDHFSDWLEPELDKLGYKGVYQKKPNSPGLRICGLEDGCAIFWRTKLFHCSEQSHFNFIDTKQGKPSNQIVITVTLNVVGNPEKQLVVANTHLKSQKDAEGETLREDQAKQLLTKLESSSPKKPLIICMDMNGTPVGHKYPSLAYPVIRSHSLKLGSAYGGKTANDEPPYTTWKLREGGEAKHTIDYIFYSEESLEPTKIWSIPDGTIVGPERLPSARYPSDHFSLAAHFRWK